MYNINRLEASEILWISIRSIDRYVKSGKIRSKKDWKIVLLNSDDIKALNSEVSSKQKIIINPEIKSISNPTSWIVKKDEYEKILTTFDTMFSSFREEIKEKDYKIQELYLELWKVREQKNNSIDLMEYKKIQFISEETKKWLSNSLENEKKQKDRLNIDLKYEKTTNKLLIIFIIILFIVSWIIFFINI